jgi:hypothetical protein
MVTLSTFFSKGVKMADKKCEVCWSETFGTIAKYNTINHGLEILSK